MKFSTDFSVILVSEAIVPTVQPANNPKGVQREDILAIYFNKLSSKPSFFLFDKLEGFVFHLSKLSNNSGEANRIASLTNGLSNKCAMLSEE
ncbi:hypothetical protein D3C80_1478510 [compost metagenome]